MTPLKYEQMRCFFDNCITQVTHIRYRITIQSNHLAYSERLLSKVTIM